MRGEALAHGSLTVQGCRLGVSSRTLVQIHSQATERHCQPGADGRARRWLLRQGSGEANEGQRQCLAAGDPHRAIHLDFTTRAHSALTPSLSYSCCTLISSSQPSRIAHHTNVASNHSEQTMYNQWPLATRVAPATVLVSSCNRISRDDSNGLCRSARLCRWQSVVTPLMV